MTEEQYQAVFTRTICQFTLWLFDQGYEVTDGEAYRTPEMVAIDVQKGAGISTSLHPHRRARDMNIFLKGIFLQTKSDLQILGDKWESMSQEGMTCRWGGNFTKPDTDHFSMQKPGEKSA